MARSLSELFEFYGTDKGPQLNGIISFSHNYGLFYDRIFTPLKDKEIRLLEMGLHCHGEGIPSIFSWRDFFSKAAIVGFDQTDFSRHGTNRITIVRGNQQDTRDLKRLAEYGPFDIIIDDCSHKPEDQLIALMVLYPSLKVGGFYIIEDLSVDGISSWHGYENGRVYEVLASFTNVEYFTNQHKNHCLACITKMGDANDTF